MSNDSNNYPSSNRRESTPRKLPAPPLAQESKRASRPLPRIPRALVSSAIPPDSRSFRGFFGKASLFTETYNVMLAKPGVQLMVTGAHTMQEVTCGICSSYLGWKIVRAHEKTESWKDGHFLMELENLYVQPDLLNPRRSSSGSDSDYSP
ncbi:hypothetical protein NLJ89_g873 [Agrocybe chaxingu]|uniref:Yippee domain-containing protein n=1 Tax=Agrocybe chaxingu TaxID=84603 RepID=A0A9W8N0Z9_9AGAR|nr:hypothetical protein NLJ89_g873 [Agrocybe chaxingu]